MILLRKTTERGHANHGWLDSYHTFSFADYYDPNFMGFRSLRVINEDRIAGGGGFPPHPHRDMEIITYMVDGALEHQDSMGNKAVIRPLEVQRMTAGTGVVHSEFNASPDRPAHLLQIWIMTDKSGHKPGYEQKSFEEKLTSSSIVLGASQDGRDGSVKINQDVDLYLGKTKGDDLISLKMKQGRFGWVQLVRGELKINGETLLPGDGAAVIEEEQLRMEVKGPSEFLFFDLN